MGALYYNPNPKDWTYQDIAREIQSRCRQIRMLDPNNFIAAYTLIHEIKQLVDNKIIDVWREGKQHGIGTSNTN